MVEAATVPPPPPTVHGPPASTKLPLPSIDTQLPAPSAPVVVINFVVLPETVPTVGAAPAPPPMTGRLAVNAPDETMVVAPVNASTPPDVPEASPVPPCAGLTGVKPVVREPDANAPTLVRDEFTTPGARIEPVSVPAGAMTGFDPADVMRPLALTMKLGIEIDDPNEPTLELTVASVVAVAPGPVPVTSPVSEVTALATQLCEPRKPLAMVRHWPLEPPVTDVEPTTRPESPPGNG